MHSATNLTIEQTLRDQLSEALSRLRELNQILGQEWSAPAVLALTRSEERILGALVRSGKLLSMPQLYTAIYGERLDPPEPIILNVHIHRMRKKLRPHGVEIANVWGRGYRIAPEHLERLNALYDHDERQPEESA